MRKEVVDGVRRHFELLVHDIEKFDTSIDVRWERNNKRYDSCVDPL